MDRNILKRLKILFLSIKPFKTLILLIKSFYSVLPYKYVYI